MRGGLISEAPNAIQLHALLLRPQYARATELANEFAEELSVNVDRSICN